MGRAPCCDKANVKRGPWSPEEDTKLKAYIEQNGTGGNWIALPQKIGLKRCGKSCRLRWLNYLRPNIKHGGFSEEEDNIICSLYISIGSRWSIIAAQLPGRTDNDIKNYWNTRLKKKLLGKQRKEQQARRSISQKQEMNKGRENSISMISDNNNQNPFFPDQPIHFSNQETRFNDHDSIRNLLIELGGRFSDDDQSINGVTNLHYPIDISSLQPLYEQSINFPSATSMETLNITSSLSPNSQYSTDGVSMPMLTGESSFTAEFENQERIDGMEFMYGNIFNNMSSLVNPTVASNYGGLQQATLQECSFDEFTYPGVH